MSKEIPFEKSFASHEKAQYWSDKNVLKPNEVMKGSHKKFWFNCECGHEILLIIKDICSGQWCGYCNNKKLCNNLDCSVCFEKSFASHEKSKYLSVENKHTARQIFKFSGKKYNFKCNYCNHNFITVIASITTKNTFCPYCCTPPQKICINDCNYCYNKSFASIDKSKYLIDKSINTNQIYKFSNLIMSFKCPDCMHTFNKKISHIANNSWCPYCSNYHKLCDNNDCIICFNNSFVSHNKSQYWSSKNKIIPRFISKCNGNKYWFNCEKGHEFDMALNNINAGKWCRFCVNKTEQIVFDKLQPIYNNLQQQYKVEWCRNTTYLPFDFVLEDNKIIIELDGRQHFEQVRNWDTPEKTQERDKYKMKQANDNGYSVIRLLQEDVYYNTYQWLDELKTNIEKIITESKVQNIFMCKDNEYKIFEVLE